MITPEEMRELEQDAIDEGTSQEEMMENAGRGTYEIIKEKYDLEKHFIVVFAGHGNNAGDAFVAARHLAEECPVTVLLFGEEEKMTEAARKNYGKLEKTDIRKVDMRNISNLQLSDGNMIQIDAFLGLGAEGKLRDPIFSGVKRYNLFSGKKISIDIPTGLDPDTGELLGDTACNFDLLITFHDIKKGLKKHKDKTEIVDIGVS